MERIPDVPDPPDRIPKGIRGFKRAVRPRPARESGFALRTRRRAEALGVSALAAFCRALGVDAASATFGFVWRTLGPLNRRHARALANLAQAFPDMAPEARERIARASWENLGRTMAEGFLLDRIDADPSRFDDHASPLLAALSAGGRGVVAASAHFGNWELGARGMGGGGFAVAGVYKAIRNPQVDALVTARRAPFYPGGLHTASPDTPRRLMRWVRAGNALVLLADLRDARGAKVPFFGAPAPSTTFPALVARLSGAPLIAGRVTRTGGARFRLDCEEIVVPRTQDRAADMLAATAALQATFERWIRQNPEQWMWGMRRWS